MNYTGYTRLHYTTIDCMYAYYTYFRRCCLVKLEGPSEAGKKSPQTWLASHMAVVLDEERDLFNTICDHASRAGEEAQAFLFRLGFAALEYELQLQGKVAAPPTHPYGDADRGDVEEDMEATREVACHILARQLLAALAGLSDESQVPPYAKAHPPKPSPSPMPSPSPIPEPHPQPQFQP